MFPLASFSSRPNPGRRLLEKKIVAFHSRHRSALTQCRNLKEFCFHMKRMLAIALTLASGLSLSAFAQSPAAPAAAPAGPSKIAVIAFQAAVAQTNEFQRNYADLEKKFTPKRDQLKAMNDQIEAQTKQLQTSAATLSESERASKAADIETKKKQLQRDAEDAQNDFQQEMQDMFKGVASKVYETMTSYAKDQGYSVVLDASEQENPVLYAVDSINITKPVLDAYNQKSGIPAPAAVSDAPVPHTTTHPATHSTTSH